MNDGKKKKNERGYMNDLLEWRNEEERREGIECLKILNLIVYGMEMKQTDKYTLPVHTGRRMRESWMDEGKEGGGGEKEEEEERRREWEKRWREAGDVMNEEDVTETVTLHL